MNRPLDSAGTASGVHLSIVIVAYRSREHLERCLPSIFEQAPASVEVIVVDNDPADATGAWLRATHPDVRIVDSPDNRGYAGGNNVGFRAATGSHVFVLNPDTRLLPGAMDALLTVVERHPNAFVTPKLLLPDGRVNACGLELHPTGIVSCRGLGERSSDWSGVIRVPLVSGAAFIAPRAALDALGGFDDDYFLYLEDADLSLRARLRGHDVVCAADAAIEHDYGLTMTPTKFYYLERNRLLTLLKVYELRTLLWMAPAIGLTGLATFAYALRRGPGYLLAILKGWAWLVQHRRTWWAKRRATQRDRVVGDASLLEDANIRLPLDQLMSDPARTVVLERVAHALYALVLPGWRARQP